VTAEHDTPVAILVESDVLVRMTASDMLIDAGFQTIEAGDAQEALALLTAHHGVRLLITSRRLPGDVDGITLTHIARRHRPDLGIIVTTGGGDIATLDLPDGVKQLRKPYAFSNLLQEVQQVLLLEGEAAPGAPVMLQGLPSAHPGCGDAAGAGEIAVPVSKPDKS
jgi:DNA-binding NtrC family response regulator